jgi:FkbM family methyltransferase
MEDDRTLQMRILFRKFVRRGLRHATTWRTKRRDYATIWIDVGAHDGETTLQFAAANPRLLVYAFEPNLPVATRLMGRLANYVVIPAAISEQDGLAELNVASYEQSSSLLPFDKRGLASWRGGEDLSVVSRVMVQTMRLDTFLNAADVREVAFLKIDAQGLDLGVVRSLGDRLRDVRRIQLEAAEPGHRQYSGSADRDDVTAFMQASGFVKVIDEPQSYGQEVNLTFDRQGAGRS